MSMSTRVVLLRDKNDPEHVKKVAVLRALVEAGISNWPIEIEAYFDGMDDEDMPLEIDFKPREWKDEYRQGYEIDIEDLPENVKTIRFYNSW